MKEVVLIGRANVGKSSLLNALLGYRRTIVLDFAGTTVDRVAERPKWGNGQIELVDTLGIMSENPDLFHVQLGQADLAIFVVDVQAGITPLDRWIQHQLKLSGVTVWVVANKIEGLPEGSGAEFAGFGFDQLHLMSVAHRVGVADLRDAILQQIMVSEEVAEQMTTVTLLGRPNTGKSTLLNRLVQKNVSAVSPKPLTTRDYVVQRFQNRGRMYQVIDTAGIRRPRSKKEDVEIFSVQASQRALRLADVALLCIASHESITDQDMRLLNMVERSRKPAVILLNFWDQLEESARKDFVKNTDFAQYVGQFPSLAISGKTGFSVSRLLPLVDKLARKASERMKTSQVNRMVRDIVTKNPPPTRGKKSFNILYSSQVKAQPPTFVLFTNRQESMPESYQKYIENQLKKKLGLKGQALRIYFRMGSKST